MQERPWQPPARHWQDRPEVVAGRDLLAGGSWMGVNDYGLAAAVMNRYGSLGPVPGRRSRGELVLEALDHGEAADAAAALAQLEPGAYRPFNLVVGDLHQAYWIRNDGTVVNVQPIPPGLHMLTAGELDDQADLRIGTYLPRFRAAPTPSPESSDWHGWSALLGSREPAAGGDARTAMCFRLDTGFGTLCSGLIAVPSRPGPGGTPLMHFAAGAPDCTPFLPVDSRSAGYDVAAPAPPVS
jgi:hypothetical protein